MNIPNNISARWIATLADNQLVAAESSLHTVFQSKESEEKLRSGARYVLLQGPPALVNAWLRWLLVSNAAQSRGLRIRHVAVA